MQMLQPHAMLPESKYTHTHTHSSFANMDKPYLAVLRKMHFRGKWHHYHINDFQPNTSANVATHTHTAVNVILVTHNFSASHTNKHTQSKNSALTSHTAFKNRLALLVLMAFNPTLMYGENMAANAVQQMQHKHWQVTVAYWMLADVERRLFMRSRLSESIQTL